MTYLVLSAALLIVGNAISNRGVGLTRANEYRSPAWAAGSRRISVGTAINMIGGVLLVVGVFTLDPPLRTIAIGAALLFWGRDVSTRASVTCRECRDLDRPETELRSAERAVSIGTVMSIVGGVLLVAGIWSLLS
jgi:uncharacterized membrane protein